MAAFTYFPTGTFAVVRASSVVGTFAASPSAGVVAGCNIVVATSIYLVIFINFGNLKR